MKRLWKDRELGPTRCSGGAEAMTHVGAEALVRSEAETQLLVFDPKAQKSFGDGSKQTSPPHHHS